MDSNQILNSLPEEVREQVVITEKKDHFKLSHPYMEDKELFSQIQEAIEKLGGKYNGYYSGAGHYEIPKTAKGVKPHVVSMDKTEPPKLGTDSPAMGSALPEEIGVKLVNVDKLVPSPWWPREKEEDQELIESIKKYGVRQNLEARPRKDGKFELTYGHRRLFAAREAGLQVVPVKIRALTDEEVLLIQFEENDKHKIWSAMETTRYLKTMMEKLGCKTQKELAQKIGKSESWISRYMQIEKIAPGQFLLGEPKTPIEQGELTERQARELLKAPEEKREEILKQAKETGKLPSAREIQRRVMPRVCENCGVASSDVEDWNSHGINLCKRCRADADKHPERYLGAKRTSEVTEQIKTIKPEKIKDTWEYRRARMQPQHSKMEQVLLLKLQTEKIGPVVIDRAFCLQTTTPDFYFPQKQLAIYLDGIVHQGKEDRDEKLRDLLAKRHSVKVLSIPYTSMSKQEIERIFTLIKEA